MEKEELEIHKKGWKQVAENTIKHRTKKKHFTIRLFESDIDSIKAQALREGLPYQTYLASMIHSLALYKDQEHLMEKLIRKDGIATFSTKDEAEDFYKIQS